MSALGSYLEYSQSQYCDTTEAGEALALPETSDALSSLCGKIDFAGIVSSDSYFPLPDPSLDWGYPYKVDFSYTQATDLPATANSSENDSTDLQTAVSAQTNSPDQLVSSEQVPTDLTDQAVLPEQAPTDLQTAVSAQTAQTNSPDQPVSPEHVLTDLTDQAVSPQDDASVSQSCCTSLWKILTGIATALCYLAIGIVVLIGMALFAVFDLDLPL